MFCDLDHALYSKRGSDDLTKGRDAHAFVQKYMEDIPGFVKFIAELDFSVCDGYKGILKLHKTRRKFTPAPHKSWIF